MNDHTRADAEALFFEGNASMAAGDLAHAETCLRKALQMAPDFAEAYANLGLLLERQGDTKDAESCFRRSIELKPSYAETHLNLGALLAVQKRFDEAEAAYKQSIALRPNSPAGWSNLGALYACIKREDEAEQCYRAGLVLDATHASTRFNLGYLLLRQGRFEEGWHCLEARNWYAALAAHLTCPRWQGEALAGKSLLIGYEAGHGDVIQFCRYAALLKAQGAGAITLLCHPGLKTLLATLDGVDTVIAYDEQIPTSGWDYWTPLLSLPYYCKTRLDNIPANTPYLQAAPDRIAHWSSLVPQDGLRIGLVWKGNPQFENDADRSLPSLNVLAPLWAIAGAHFVSLQKGAGEDEAMQPPRGLPLINFGYQLQDFADTAALVMNLDLVICVDTAVAHLTGALGKPCWVLLPDYKTDWRWLTHRSDSPWYPGVMRLFHQSKMGDWADVVAAVATALERLTLEGGTP